MKHYQLIAHGQVQGVGFRWGVYQYTHSRPINGYVHNNTDGTVTIECQATTSELSALISFIKAGPTPYAHVTHLSLRELPVDPHLIDFSIR